MEQVALVWLHNEASEPCGILGQLIDRMPFEVRADPGGRWQ